MSGERRSAKAVALGIAVFLNEMEYKSIYCLRYTVNGGTRHGPTSVDKLGSGVS